MLRRGRVRSCIRPTLRGLRTAGPDAIRSLAPKQIYVLEWRIPLKLAVLRNWVGIPKGNLDPLERQSERSAATDLHPSAEEPYLPLAVDPCGDTHGFQRHARGRFISRRQDVLE